MDPHLIRAIRVIRGCGILVGLQGLAAVFSPFHSPEEPAQETVALFRRFLGVFGVGV